MSKKQLAKDALKSFLKTVKKIKSFDLKKTFTEDGKTFSKLSIIVKHKTDEVPELKTKKKKKKKSSKKSSKKKSDKVKSKEKKTSDKSSKASEQKTKKKATEVQSKDSKPTSPKVESKVVEAKKVATAEPVKTPPKSPAPIAEAKAVDTKTSPVPKAEAPASKAKAPAPKTAAAPSTPAAKPPVKRATRTRKPTVGDNLKLIEGIGPKIESFLKEDGIDTFEKLSKAIPDDIQKMMVAKGGTRYNANNPTTWPEQAALAAKGDMEAFNALKLELKGGRRA